MVNRLQIGKVLIWLKKFFDGALILAKMDEHSLPNLINSDKVKKILCLKGKKRKKWEKNKKKWEKDKIREKAKKKKDKIVEMWRPQAENSKRVAQAKWGMG